LYVAEVVLEGHHRRGFSWHGAREKKMYFDSTQQISQLMLLSSQAHKLSSTILRGGRFLKISNLSQTRCPLQIFCQIDVPPRVDDGPQEDPKTTSEPDWLLFHFQSFGGYGFLPVVQHSIHCTASL